METLPLPAGLVWQQAKLIWTTLDVERGVSEELHRNETNHGSFGPGKGRVVRDWLFGPGAEAESIASGGNRGFIDPFRKCRTPSP
jgi:hypothetical protein